jgi:hypothetical protein
MTKRRDMTTICLVSTIAVLFGVLLYFVCKCKFTEKYNSNKKLPMKVQPKQQVSTDTYNKITDLIKLSTMKDTSTVFPQSNMFNSEVLNHRIVLVQKVFEMLNGRVDRLVKLGEKYPNVKPSDKVKPQEMQVEIDKIRSIVKKIPIFKKHDYTKVFTRGIDPKSKEYTSLYYLGMQQNDNMYKTNLCSKDKQCIKVLERLTKVSKKREEVLKDVSIKYNKGLVSKETFDWGLSDTPAKGKKNNCYWNGPVSYGNFCGPTKSVSAAEKDTGGPCDALDACCYDHDVGYGKCQRAGDWCLQNAGAFTGTGFCTSSLCVAGVDAQLCQCAITTLTTTIATLGLVDEVSIDSWSGLPYSLLQIVIFCTYRWIIALIIGTIYAIVYVGTFIVELIVDVASWIWDLVVDLAEWFGDTWDDFWNWCKSWLPTMKNPDYIPNSGSNIDTESGVSGLMVAVVSEEGSAVDQVTRITDKITNLFNTKPTKCNPIHRKCGNCCEGVDGREGSQYMYRSICCLIESDSNPCGNCCPACLKNETESQCNSRIDCCARNPDEKYWPGGSDCSNMEIPKPEQLRPQSPCSNVNCESEQDPVLYRNCCISPEINTNNNCVPSYCDGRFLVSICTDPATGSSSRSISNMPNDKFCCKYECNNQTGRWAKVCGHPMSGIDTITRGPDIGIPCTSPAPTKF